MISKKFAKLINILPSKLSISITKKILDQKIDRYATISVIGSEKLERLKLPTIFICNHLSNADGLVLSRVLHRINPTFVAGVKLSNDEVTKLGVHVIKTTNIRPDGMDKEGIKKIIQLIQQGESIVIFPEGTRSRTGSLIKAKKGVLLLAGTTGAPIVPLGIIGTEQLLPINKAGDMGKETFHYANVSIVIGDQFELQKKQKAQEKAEYEEAAMEYVMTKIADLLPEDYKGVYKRKEET